ncbi:MAG: bifunctional oligoribonuclease/PAP phosphatase NrnA [Schaedlerella sp.]|nr:bifunctional oligoribonuclease/PAP phosphatase NrnA [Schaedlerella sp.]
MKFKLSEILKDKKTVALGGHVRPDGDCVGSCMGLYMYLTEQFPDISFDVYLESVAPCFKRIQRTEEIKNTVEQDKIYDLFICLDCGSVDRLGFSGGLFEQAKRTACIDHHISNDAFADHNYIVPEASSASELVYNLLESDKISKECAEALYMGIAHDTGIFQYSCTSPETMIIGADLLRKGIDGSDLIEKTYYEKSFVQTQILGKALVESFLILDKQCIVSFVSKKDMEFFDALPGDLDGIVSILRQTEGTEVAIFLYELEPGVFKVSLRSKGKVNVSSIARYFGGGGHVRASGASMSGDVYEIIDKLAEQIGLQLKGSEKTA